MSKIELDNITSGYNLGKINANFVKIENALTNNVLFRDATGSTAGPNQMVQDIDMDSQSILNLPTPTEPTNPVRLQDLGDYATSTELTEVDNRLTAADTVLQNNINTESGLRISGDAILTGAVNSLDGRVTTLEQGTSGTDLYIHWLYNNGLALGGEVQLNIPYEFTSIATVYINGVRMSYGLAFDFDVAAKTVQLAEPLVTGDEVVVSLGVEPQEVSALVQSITEEVVLTDGQTVVTFVEQNTNGATYYINGPSVDSRFLSSEDFTASSTTNTTITLTESYPAGSIITLSKNVAGSGGIDGDIRREFVHNEPTLAVAVTSTLLRENDAINLRERTSGNGGGAMWDVVLSTSVTENTFNIVQCTGVPTLSLVLRLGDKVYHSQFGVVADSSTLDRTIGTDNSNALNAAFSVSYDLQKASVLPAGAIRHTIPLIIQKAGDKSFTVESSKGGTGSGRARLMFDANASLLANKNQCITYGGTMEFHGVGFTHNDTNRNLDTSCLFHTRTDINTKQDIDHKFFDCLFTGAEYVATTYGRGWWCYDSDVSLVRNVLRLEWPAGFDGTLLAPEQQLTTGMRGYRLMRNKLHASANGHLIVNIGYNRKNVNNIQVQNNNFDTPMGLLKGSARDSSFDNNLCLYASSVDFFVLNDDKVENVTAKNNYSGVNTTDLNEPFNTVVSNSASIIDGFDFSGSTFSHAARTLFFNSGGSVYGLKINNCTFNDILQNNNTAATRYIFSEVGGTSVGNVEFVNNTISNYVRTFNTATLFDVLAANCVNIKSHSNSFDVDTVPLLPVQLQGLLSNIHTFAYSGTGTDPLTVFSGTDGRIIKVAIVSERFGGATADKTFMTNDQGTSSDPFYLSADKLSVLAKADCNTLNGYYQVTLIY